MIEKNSLLAALHGNLERSCTDKREKWEKPKDANS
jgi:hypothetical protein